MYICFIARHNMSYPDQIFASVVGTHCNVVLENPTVGVSKPNPGQV